VLIIRTDPPRGWLPARLDTSRFTDPSTDLVGDTMPDTPDRRRRRRARLLVLAAAVRGACTGAARALTEWLLQ